ncbi:hypothetical protein SMD22_00380 (plasmid) [Brevibacillus halotolerans]|nr:hypothetical protein SMD22_00380 [Brevibacillus halotolerans]
MKTIDQVFSLYSRNKLEGRELSRLSLFIPEEYLYRFGLGLSEESKGKHQAIPFTKENVLMQLKKDVEFGFEKALWKKGLSAAMMFEVVRTWNWILEDGLEDWDANKYGEYGLPLFKATALKYGLYNPIGEDEGNELEYASEYESEYE